MSTRAPSQIDVPYGTHSEKLDVYANPGAPVVVFVHQGGWADGDKSQAAPIAAQLWQYEVVVPNYRLDVDGFTYPAPVDDVTEAIDWAFDNVVDDRPVGVLGFSAGGQVGMLAAMGDPRIATIDTWSSPTDLVYMLAAGAAVRPIRKYLGGADPGAASPITHVTTGLCPIQMHGSKTDFVPWAIQLSMRDALTARGNVAEALIWPRGHAMAYGTFAWPPTLAWLADKLV